jgi:hypothetical protein
MKKLIRVYFWIGVNVIGIPELFIHNLNPKTFTEKSKIFGDKRTNVYLFNQTLELL